VVVFGLIHPLGPPPNLPARHGLDGRDTARPQSVRVRVQRTDGVEAIANAPVVQGTRVKRAQRTELLLGVILGSLLLGLAQLTVKFHLRPKANITLLSQITERAVGHNATYYIVELATTAALALAPIPASAGSRSWPVSRRDSFLPGSSPCMGADRVPLCVVVLAILPDC